MSSLLPVLPLRDIVVLPGMTVPLFVGRERSIRAVTAASEGSQELLLCSQKKSIVNEPAPDDIHMVGVLARLSGFARHQDDIVKITAIGGQRVRIDAWHNADFLSASYTLLTDEAADSIEVAALARTAKSTFETYTKTERKIAPETLQLVLATEDPGLLADLIVALLTTVKLADKQTFLELLDTKSRLERACEFLQQELGIVQVEKRIRSRVKKQMERTQKEYYLNEQMQAIQRELGERDEFKAEMQELEEKMKDKTLSAEADGKIKKEMRKLRMMPPMSAESTVVRNYVDWILDLPWGKKTEDNRDIDSAEKVLDEDHYGLSKIKDRILEYLAVQALVQKLKGPVLCLVGPPGVGKTSLAKSIARATNRKFVRLSLGGVRDEAEIRGHRRTYIGAMPGRLVQSLKKAETDNPVFLLDEIDKMSSDFRGDPASALLEVLDPEQNKAFSDHYLDLDYDLSDVMFVTTANSLSGIPVPLLDRMEVIELSGYTDFEKLNIAEKYLVPRQKIDAGLADVSVTFEKEAIFTLIHHYTKESGVRNLEREIGSVCRKLARELIKQRKEAQTENVNVTFVINAADVEKYLGPLRYRDNPTGEENRVGLTTGLAVTSYGGTLLDCEATVVTGKGLLVVTGLLEKGMQESAQAALSYIRSRQNVLGLAADFHQTLDIHVHFPEFVPKDGPSAGVTMATSIASALMKVPVRRNVAMTGEITLRGRVMPIGGVKEKVLAAHRNKMKTVLLPIENRSDLIDVPPQVLQELRIVFVSHMDEVLREALVLENPGEVFGEMVPSLALENGVLLHAESNVIAPATHARQ